MSSLMCQERTHTGWCTHRATTCSSFPTAPSFSGPPWNSLSSPLSIGLSLIPIFRSYIWSSWPWQRGLPDSLVSCLGKFTRVTQWNWLSATRPLPPSGLISSHFFPCYLCCSPSSHFYVLKYMVPFLSLKLWPCCSPSLECFTRPTPHIVGLSFTLTWSERTSLTPRPSPIPLNLLVSQTSYITAPPLLKIAFEVSSLLNNKLSGAITICLTHCSVSTASQKWWYRVRIMIPEVEDVSLILTPGSKKCPYLIFGSELLWWTVRRFNLIRLRDSFLTADCALLLELFQWSLMGPQRLLLRQPLCLQLPAASVPWLGLEIVGGDRYQGQLSPSPLK